MTTANRTVLYAITFQNTALTLLRGQLAYLRAAGFDVHLACGSSPELERFAEREGVHLHDVPLTRKWLTVDDLRALPRAVRVLREVRPDVLNYSTPKAALVWAVASWLSRPALVVYLLRGLRLEGERPRSPGSALLWLTELVACRSADVVVCVGHELRQKTLGLRLARRGRAVVLGRGSSNGVDCERFEPSSELRHTMRSRLGFGESDVVVGFVGRLRLDKGLHDLLDALTLARSEVRCLFVGPSEQDFDLARLLDERGLAVRATHVDFTLDIKDYYAAMDLLVLPTHGEGLPNALLEAQAMGLPCITTDATGCRDAVQEDVTALVVPTRSPELLAGAIDRLAESAQLREAFGAAGRRWVLENFDPETQWRRYSDLYDQAGKGEPATGHTSQTREIA